ncbi:transcriptional regulator [Alistipes finegoldii]
MSHAPHKRKTKKDIKQTWPVEKLGKSFSVVNTYVCNRRQLSLEQLFEIARIRQVNPKFN